MREILKRKCGSCYKFDERFHGVSKYVSVKDVFTCEVNKEINFQ